MSRSWIEKFSDDRRIVVTLVDSNEEEEEESSGIEDRLKLTPPFPPAITSVSHM